MENENNLPESLEYFKCRACGKRRYHTDINTFQHPIVDDNSIQIMGYEHFNYCYDNLVCYLKALKRERIENE